ncbi:MAG TPA: isoprenylcysteine carboxylmethyltransferase family protein [Xanthobacteraceae bacterium]|nr:isoprenylcysteine carboxylmethyltransferase family protein [Xanthobacteraceae bacterium]
MNYRLYEAPFAVLWLAWLAYWIVAAGNVKAVRRREPLASRLGHVALSALAAALLAFPDRRLPWLDERFLPRTMIAYWLGLIMLAVGIVFAVWARNYLGRNWSGSVTVKQNHELIRTGPYRLVRHPIYSGLLLAILGTAIAFGEWRGLLAFALLTGSLLLKLRIEERFMSESFPNEYARYRAEVPALIPFIGRARAANTMSG